jgi:hypothetical protein
MYDLPCVYSLASAVAISGRSNGQAEAENPTQRYSVGAVELLRQAVAKGYKDAERLKKDKDLDCRPPHPSSPNWPGSPKLP